MFLHRGQLLRGARSVTHARPKSRHRPHYHLPHQLHSTQARGPGRNKVPRSKTTFGKIIWISVGALAWGQVVISYMYEPLRDNGVFTNIAQSTIFRAIPAKLAHTTEREESELYQPITGDKEIRLLILEPGAHEDALKCQLVKR
ncbi:hypothetical protein FOIG_11315 [Fusarium odoratissimum NRRL 54006]|uniref:Uncharacterized protein n=2 Tax=Fusarium oxysporum species complex TaxID=171631 RepID=X0JJ68_FUSO5|nr:uncharacterized protein FOIG_11315 [Fusarium odoratissimum NRRL 54006]EXL96355.1 hypothetical protein FOIG_11315 [Fusarium odoratissimum NRRL 54006]TXC00470.1 hypothetical protein FocTR4_00013719 [Fusarium oxysporum f. sp. cubense]